MKCSKNGHWTRRNQLSNVFGFNAASTRYVPRISTQIPKAMDIILYISKAGLLSDYAINPEKRGKWLPRIS